MSDTITVGEFEIVPTDGDSGIIVRGRGGNRAISAPELCEMVDTDGPVTVR